MKDVDIVRGMNDGSIPMPEGKESDELIKLHPAKTKAMVAAHDEVMAIQKLIAATGVTDEVRRRVKMIKATVEMGEVTLRADLAAHKQLVKARKKRSKNAKKFDPIYQKAADFIRSEPGGVFLSKRKVAIEVRARVAKAIAKDDLKNLKLASVETIRKHII